jgi:hypothetical protein
MKCPIALKEAEMTESDYKPEEVKENEEEEFPIPIKPPLISHFLKDEASR